MAKAQSTRGIAAVKTFVMGAVLVVAGVFGPAAAGESVSVSNGGELAKALASAQGGEVIVLADGHYDTLEVPKDYKSTVTITSQNNGGATFSNAKVRGGNVTIDGVSVLESFEAIDAHNITVKNSKFTGFTLFRYSSDFKFDSNLVGGNGSIHGVFVESSNNFEVTNNRIADVQSDLLRVDGNSFNGLVENNTLYDMKPVKFDDGTYVHADALQMFGNARGTPHDIIIRGNYIYDDPKTGDQGNLWGQGIFLGGPTGGYRNIIIEQNLIATDSPNALFLVNGPEGNIIRHNTVLGSGKITVYQGDSSGTEIYGNVARTIDARDGAKVGDNYIYNNGNIRALFQGAGDGSTWEGFIPREHTPIGFQSDYGALDRLKELMSGKGAGPDDRAWLQGGGDGTTRPS